MTRYCRKCQSTETIQPYKDSRHIVGVCFKCSSKKRKIYIKPAAGKPLIHETHRLVKRNLDFSGT